MIHLCYSNRTEELVAALARNLERDRARPDRPLLAPTRLVVPNRNVEAYVKLSLAALRGIAANLEVTFLRRLLARVAEATAERSSAAAPVLVDAAQIEGMLLALLCDEAALAADPELAPVRRYVSGPTPDACDRRRVQLAARLGRLFDEYASSRPRLLAEWRRGRLMSATLPHTNSELTSLEVWQRALWLRLFGGDGRLEARAATEKRVYLTWDRVLEAAPAVAAELGPTLHVFGISYVGESYHRLMAALAQHVDVHLYTLNPCREFWEDVASERELRRRDRRALPTRAEARQTVLSVGDDPLGLADDVENLPLRWWGRPGRENVRILNQMTEADFEARFRSHAEAQSDGAKRPRTLLERLQDDVLDRRAPVGAPTDTLDDSLVVLPCPGLRRELEVVAGEIWAAIHRDPTLRFNDIAVVIPEARRDEYLGQISAVFGESHELPHNVNDLPAAAAQRVVEAVLLLTNVPLGTLSRRELMPALVHPTVLAAIPGATPSFCLQLVEDLGVVYGADHNALRGGYAEADGDLFSWEQGLRRLALGAFMEGPASGCREPVAMPGGGSGEALYLPVERPGDEHDIAMRFGGLVSSLLEDARCASGASGPRLRPMNEWATFLRGMVTGYIHVQDESEAAARQQVLGAIAELEEIGLGETPISYRIAASLLHERLGSLTVERGQHLAWGVTVTAFVPMRAVPFRVVFVLGLGHGEFPRGARRDELDLRALQRLPGDVTPREQDLYMFLETLLCCRERLVLSYVARDELTGHTLEPSSVLLELEDVLAHGYVTEAAVRRLRAEAPRTPLRRYQDEARLAAHPLAVREAAAHRLGATLPVPPPSVAALRSGLAPAATAALTPLLALAPTGTAGSRAARSGAPETLTTIPLSSLRQFLEDPLQGSARFRLRMREQEGDEELLDREEEPFASARLDRVMRLRAALGAGLARGEGLPGALAAALAWNRERLRHETLAGRAPAGLFARAEGGNDADVLRLWMNGATEAAGGRPPRGRAVRFGRVWDDSTLPATRLDGLRLTLPGAETGRDAAAIEIVGQTELLAVTGNGSHASFLFSLRTPKPGRSQSQSDRDRLRALLDYVALTALEVVAENPGGHRAFLIISDGHEAGSEAIELAPLSAADARAYLADLSADLLTGARDDRGAATGVHDYLLPHEPVWKNAGDPDALIDAIEDLRELYLMRNIGFASVYGPVPHAVERYEPPARADAAALVARRFGPLLRLLPQDSPRRSKP